MHGVEKFWSVGAPGVLSESKWIQYKHITSKEITNKEKLKHSKHTPVHDKTLKNARDRRTELLPRKKIF